LPVHVTLRDDAGTATAMASGSALVVSPTTLDLIDPLYGAVADLLGPFFQGFFGITNERIGLLTTIPATEGVALTLPNILGDVPLPPDIPDMLLTSIPVAAFIDGNLADTATDFIALINWGDGTTTQGAVTLVASQDFDAAPGFVPPLHAAVFMVTGTHTYADESASEPLSVGIIRISDNLSGTLHRSATIDFGHPAVVAGVTVAEADVLVPVPLGPLTANPNVVDGVVARFTDANLASVAGDFAASIDWGDGTGTSGTISEVNGTITVSGTHAYANAGKYPVLVRLIDDDGGASATLQREAFIGLPLSGEVTLASATEHVVLANTSIASFVAFDANAPASTFTATIDWGDGSSSPGTVVGVDGSFTVQGGHTYAEEGSYALHTTIATAEAAVSLDGSVRVADHDVLTAAQPSLTIEATQGSAFSGVVASFTDNDLVSPASDFTASIDWGDGTTTSGIVSGSNGSFTVSGTHNYGIAGKLPPHVTLSDDGAGTASAVAAGSALVVSPETLDLIDPLYGAVADLLGPFFQGFFGVTDASIGLLTTIPASEGVALTLPNILGDVPLPPDIPDMLLTSIPVAAFIDGNPADTATDFIALINWGDGTTTQGAVTLVASQDFDPAPGFVPPLHAAVFMVTGTHTYADESASEPLSVGIIRTSDNLSGTLHRSATIDFGHPAVVAGVTVAEADVLAPVPLGPLTANFNVVDGVVARFTNTNLASTAGDFIATIDWGDGTTTTGTIDDVSGVITVSGTHSYANSGKYALAVTLADDDGNANATAIGQLFGGAPHAPQGAADTYFTPHDQVLHVTAPGILSNDGDPDGDAITAMLSFGPQHGSLDLRADGSFDYTPASGFVGTDCFSYHDSDGSLCGAPVQVLINVRDLAPTAGADFYGVTHDRVLHVAAPGLLGNDTDPDGDTLAAVKASDPLHGSISLNADGSFDYAPNLGYIGPDSFTYRDTDGALASAPATVTLSVQDQAPVAGNDSFSVPEDATYSVSVITPPGGLLANDIDPNGDSLLAILVREPFHGTLAFEGDGGFTYHPAADYFGPDSFTYKANDGFLDSNVATVSITIDPVNDASLAQGGSASGNEDTPISGQVVATDVDNSADQLSYSVVSGPGHGSLALNAHGSFTYTPNANFNGAESFSYKAYDGQLDSNIAAVAITVNPVDDAPVAQTLSVSGNEDTPISCQVVATDIDNTPAQLSYSLVSGPAHGSVVLNSNGAFTYTPSANYNGPDSFRYKAYDGSLYSNVAAISLTIIPVNDPPVAGWNYAGCQKNSSTSADAAHGVLANTSDPDLTDVLTISAVKVFGASASAAVSAGHPAVVQGTYGKLTMNADGSYAYVANTRPGALPAQTVPQDIFTYTVNDGHGGTTTANLTITVYGPGSTYLQASASVLNGGNGQSALDGGDFRHTLIGGNGPDWLLAGRGNDTLAGGKGPDTFVFGPQIGKDVITDFDPKNDTIQFNHALFANYAAAMLSESFDGHNTSFTANHDANQTVTLQNVAPSSLSPNNFSFS
jgi:VCBS repeat-containing protein